MDAVDGYIPTPRRNDDLPFLMPVEDVFTITGRGTVATGRVERGIVKWARPWRSSGLTDEKKTVVTGIEMFRKLLDYAEAGDNVGTLLRGIDKKEIERGQVLAKPGSINPPHQVLWPGVRPVQGRGRPSPPSSTTIVLSSTSVPPT